MTGDRQANNGQDRSHPGAAFGLGKPHYSAEGEQNLLGALMADADLIPDAASRLTTDDFYEPKHQVIWDTILRLSDEGKPTSYSAIAWDLRQRGEIDRIGGSKYLSTMAGNADLMSALFWAEVIKEEAQTRQIQAYHARGLQESQVGSGVALTELLANAQSGLDEVADQSTNSGDVVQVDAVFMDTLDHIEALGKIDQDGTTGLPTGFTDLDAKTSGLHPGQMVVLAARPGGGKSTLGLDFCRSAAIKHNEPTLIFSLEMSRTEITMRLISAECRIPLQNLRTGKLSDDEWQKIGKKMPLITAAPLFIDDTANNTMREIKTKARRIQQRYGLKLIVIDYLQLMEGSDKSESRQQEVTKISRQCKLLAKELGVTVVVMSQLNRGSEGRTDKRPQVSDLRESGAIEQDADVVLLLYRDEIANPESTRIGEADIIIGKQRSGPTGTVVVAAQLHLSRFVDMQQEF